MISGWIILQIFIVLVETFIRLHVTSTHRHARLVGYATGVMAQFLWLAIFLHTHQYWLLPLLILDGSIWFRGLVLNKRLTKHHE
jgi:hypothetical protein